MQVNVVRKPMDVAAEGWEFKLRKIMEDTPLVEKSFIEQFMRAKDGGEKLDVLYDLSEQKILPPSSGLALLIREIENYGPDDILVD